MRNTTAIHYWTIGQQFLNLFQAGVAEAQAQGKSVHHDFRALLGDAPSKIFSDNSISVAAWYEALKYPERLGGTTINHLALKYNGPDGLEALVELSSLAEAIRRDLVNRVDD